MIQYKPSKREDYRTASDIYSKMSGLGKRLIEAGKVFFGVAGLIAATPYALPTMRRFSKAGENEEPSEDAPASGDIAGSLGSLAGTTAVIWQAYECSKIAEDHPEVLLIPLAGNVISGIYELGRRKFLRKKGELAIRNELEARIREAYESEFMIKRNRELPTTPKIILD